MSWTWFFALFLLFSIRLAYLEYSGNRPLCACPLNHISISNWIRTVFRRMTWMHFLGKCLHTTWFSANKSTWRESISSNFPCSRRRVHVYKQPKHIRTALPLVTVTIFHFLTVCAFPLSLTPHSPPRSWSFGLFVCLSSFHVHIHSVEIIQLPQLYWGGWNSNAFENCTKHTRTHNIWIWSYNKVTYL